MKLNENTLKEMIRDMLREGDKFTTTTGKATSGDVRSGAMAQAKEQASGLTNEERRLIKELIALLTGAAKKTNLASGTLAAKIDQLAAILQRVAGQQPEQGAPQ